MIFIFNIFFYRLYQKLINFLFSLKKFLLHVSAQRLAVKLCCNSGLNVKRYSRTSKQIFKDFSHLFDCTTWPWKLSRFFFFGYLNPFYETFRVKVFLFRGCCNHVQFPTATDFPPTCVGKNKKYEEKDNNKKKDLQRLSFMKSVSPNRISKAFRPAPIISLGSTGNMI